MKKINDRQINLLLFILLACAVVIIHSILLEPAIHLAPHSDDWKVRVWCKVLGSDIFTRFFDIVKEFGTGWTYQIYHMCFLEQLFGFNPEAFQKANIVLKSVAALSLFPLTLAIFKNRWLASLSVLLFAVGYTSSGTLDWVITGGDYLALTFMNFFLLTYYYLLSKKNQQLKWFLLLSILFVITLFFSPMRLYPLVAVSVLIELFLLLYNHSVSSLKSSLFRLVAVYGVLVLSVFKPGEVTPLWIIAGDYFNSLWQGSNLYQISLLFTAIGMIAVEPVKLGQLFGLINFENVRDLIDYNWYLLENPMKYFLILTILIAFIRSKKPLKFIILVLFLNYLADYLAFGLYAGVPYVNFETKTPPDPAFFKFLLLGLYITVVAIVSFWEWYKQNRKDGVFLALTLGPAVSILFIELTIMFGGKNITFNSGIHRYLVIPSAGIYIFIAALLTILIQKISLTKIFPFKLMLSALVILYLIFDFQSSKTQILNHFSTEVKGGRGNQDQDRIHRKLSELLDKSNFQAAEPSFFYFETPGDLATGSFFYEALTGSNFIQWIHLEKRGLAKGCVGYIFREKDKLKEAVVTKDGQKGIQYYGTCIDNNDNRINKFNISDTPNVFYKPENIYAFMLVNKDINNITDQVLAEIDLKKSKPSLPLSP